LFHQLDYGATEAFVLISTAKTFVYVSFASFVIALFAQAPAAAAIKPLPLGAPPKVTITEFNDLPTPWGYEGPACVAAGPGRALWVTYDVDQDAGASYILKIGLGGALLATYDSTQVGDIVSGPVGAVWAIADPQDTTPDLVRVTPQGREKYFFASGATPISLALGPDRHVFWFTEYASQGGYAIGRMTLGGQVSTYTDGLSSSAALWDITAGPDGAMWFTDTTGGIGRITAYTQTIREFRAGITSGSGPYSIALGPDGALWFTEYTGHRIGRITTAGVATESKTLASGASPNDIVAGPDGAMWFTENNPDMVGRISMSGQITEYSGVSAGGLPTCIVSAPDGTLWFTEQAGNRMGRVSLR
jgi:streptogramin lyase